MMLFIALPQTAQHLERRFDIRLLDKDRAETALQGGILLNMFAVLIDSGCANHLDLTAAQGWFEHIAGIDTPGGCTCTYDGVQLIDEEDHLPLRVAHLIHDSL